VCRFPEAVGHSGGPNSSDVIGREKIPGTDDGQTPITAVEPQAFIRAVGQSGGVNISGNVGDVAGDIAGTKIGAVFVQGIDLEITQKISETHDNVAEVLEVLRGDAAQPPAIDARGIFEAARAEAEEMCGAGRPEDASRAFMEALEREDRAEQIRREDYRRRCLRLLEEAVAYDKKALNADAACIKLRRIAEIIHLDDRKAQAQYLIRRGTEYHEMGKLRGDNAALHIAVSVFSSLAKDTVDVE
jgi:hypothetical protein